MSWDNNVTGYYQGHLGTMTGLWDGSTIYLKARGGAGMRQSFRHEEIQAWAQAPVPAPRPAEQSILAKVLDGPVVQTAVPATGLTEVIGPYFGHRPPGAEPEIFSCPTASTPSCVPTIRAMRCTQSLDGNTRTRFIGRGT